MDLKVSELVQRFDTGEIRLPLMQRDYVWKPKKVVRLLDSLYRGWPIGSFYVWQTQDGHLTRARVGTLMTRRLDGFYVAEREMRALGINFVFLLRCLVTVHRGNCSFSKLPRNWADDTGEIESSWRQTEQALRGAVDFVRREVGWTTRRWLPSTMALIPVVYLLAKCGKRALRGKDADRVKRYLLVSGLRSLFRGATETAVNFYVNAVRDTNGDISRRARALLNRIPKNRLFKIREEDVRNTSGMYAPLMQVYLACLFQEDAKSWPSARSLRDILQQHLPGDPLAVHHIFPKKFMQDRDFPVERLNTVANYAILSQTDNAELADRDPFDVWRGMKSNQRECAGRQLCFVASDNLLRRDAYDEFVEFRADKLAERLNVFIGLGT